MVLVKGAGAGAHPPRQAAGRRPGRRCGGARDWDGGWWGRGVRAPVPLCTQARDCTRSNGCRARQGVCLQCESGAQNRCGVRKALFRATIDQNQSKQKVKPLGLGTLALSGGSSSGGVGLLCPIDRDRVTGDAHPSLGSPSRTSREAGGRGGLARSGPAAGAARARGARNPAQRRPTRKTCWHRIWAVHGVCEPLQLV